MVFSKPLALLLIDLNEACYVACQTGTATLPAGFTIQAMVKAVAGADMLLKEDPETAWIMVVRDSTGQQYIACRGTQDQYENRKFWEEWALDLLAEPKVPFGGGRVHRGFYTAWQALRPGLVAVGVDSNAIVTGHSLGAAIATLCAVDLGLLDRTIVFACPIVGDAAFAAGLSGSIRVTNKPDIVPHVPDGVGFTNGTAQLEYSVSGPGDLLHLHVAHNLESYRAGVDLL